MFVHASSLRCVLVSFPCLVITPDRCCGYNKIRCLNFRLSLTRGTLPCCSASRWNLFCHLAKPISRQFGFSSHCFFFRIWRSISRWSASLKWCLKKISINESHVIFLTQWFCTAFRQLSALSPSLSTTSCIHTSLSEIQQSWKISCISRIHPTAGIPFSFYRILVAFV